MTMQNVLTPWRVPYPLNTLRKETDHLAIITPVLGWANLFNPGDTIEVCDPPTMRPICLGAVCFVIKTVIKRVCRDCLNFWQQGASYEDLIRALNIYYVDDLDLYSSVALIVLRLIKREEQAYECVLEHANCASC